MTKRKNSKRAVSRSLPREVLKLMREKGYTAIRTMSNQHANLYRFVGLHKQYLIDVVIGNDGKIAAVYRVRALLGKDCMVLLKEMA